MEGQTGWIMKRKRYNRKKRIIIAYTLRIIVGLVFAVILVLMICGVLFIHDRISGEDLLGRTVEASVVEKDLSNTVKKLLGNQDEKNNILSERKEYRIILDAGHGGSDGGTQGNGMNSDLVEKDINLAVVLRMKKILEDLGSEVVLTRESDDTLSLDERVEIANSNEADLFVSIHCNYYEDDASIRGLECYYYEESDCGKQLAEEILEKIKESGNADTRNAKESNFYVLKRTKVPAVLIELGYLSNVKESKLLADEQYQETLAEELVKGIVSALQ